MDAVLHAAPGYERLAEVLARAHDRAAFGKGVKRHARAGQPFHDQSIVRICEAVGTGFAFGQAMKKLSEQHPTREAAIENYLDAIVYIAAGIITLEKEDPDA